MAKKSQLDRAVDALLERKAAILAKCNAECEAIDASIRVIAAQQARRPRRPKAVERTDDRPSLAHA